MENLTFSEGHEIEAHTRTTDQIQKVQECFRSIKNDEHKYTTEQSLRYKIECAY